MGTLRYRGRPPDTDFTLMAKSAIDARYNAIKVDNAFVNSAVATEALVLSTPAYVDQQDNLRDHLTDVDAADATYLPTSSLGVANGVASLGTDNYVPAGQLPTVQTERRPFLVNASQVLLTAGQEITTVTNKGYEAARLVINDPGYAYIPVFSAYVLGGAVNSAPPSRILGSGSYGQVTVLRSDGVKYAWCFCTPTNVLDYFCAMPFGDTSTNPTSMPPLYGTTNWSMWLGLWSGSTYSFYPGNLKFFCMVYPGF